MSMRKLGAYARLMRPVNCLMMGFAVMVGAVLVRGYDGTVLGLNIVYGFVTGFTLTAASMAINDYYDRQIDIINEPDRPIPSGLIQPGQALVFALALTTIGLVSAISTTLLCFVIAVIAWMLNVTYVTIGKRSGLMGNLLVSTCVAIPFVYGSAATMGAISLNIVLFASCAFLSNTGREITKGIVDAKGDKIKKIQTLAVRYGEKTAALVASIFYFSAVLVSPVPWFLNLVTFWFIPLVILTDVGLVFSSVLLLRNYSKENAKRIKNMILVWFLIGLFGFITGSIK